MEPMTLELRGNQKCKLPFLPHSGSKVLQVSRHKTQEDDVKELYNAVVMAQDALSQCLQILQPVTDKPWVFSPQRLQPAVMTGGKGCTRLRGNTLEGMKDPFMLFEPPLLMCLEHNNDIRSMEHKVA